MRCYQTESGMCCSKKRKELWNDESKYRKEIVGISFDFLVRKRLFTAFRPVDEIFSLHPFKRPDSGICDRGCILSAIFRKPGRCLWDFAGAKSLFVLITLVFLFLVFWIYHCLPANRRFYPVYVTMMLLLSGAVGNFIDRIFRNYVVDFFSILN